MSRRNILIGQFSHETNTFSSIPADMNAFCQRGIRRGEDIMHAYRQTKTPLGGMLRVVEDRGWNALLTTAASAHPSGPVTDAAYQQISCEILRGIRQAKADRALDGVLLALHGAMVTESLADGEGQLLRQIREEAGPEVPVVCTLDFHANLTRAMIESASILFGYKTYPHVDGYQRGEEAARSLDALVDGEIEPVARLKRIPLLIPLVQQKTAEEPFARLVQLARRLRQQPDVLEATIFGGFPYADVPEAGAAALVYADGAAQPALQAAEQLTDTAVSMRQEFRVDLPRPDEAVGQALATSGRPVVLADVADNPGAGGCSRHADILMSLLDRGVREAAVFLTDPQAVNSAFGAGVGCRLNLMLGTGKSKRRVQAYVRALTDGRFTFRGPQSTGLAGSLGRTAGLLVEGIEVMVSERRVQTRDPEIFRSVGIEPSRKKILALKSSVHFRAAFEPMAARIIEVAAFGAANPSLEQLQYRRVQRPVFPLDRMED